MTDLLGYVGFDPRRMAADLQQGQHQRGEFMAERNAGEAHADVGADAPDGEGWAPRIVIRTAHAHLRTNRGDVVQQCLQFARCLAIVQRGDQLDRLRDFFQIALQLGFSARRPT